MMQEQGFITPQGRYYEADAPLSSADVAVPIRPAPNMVWSMEQGSWVPDRRSEERVPHWGPVTSPYPGYQTQPEAPEPKSERMALRDIIYVMVFLGGLGGLYTDTKVQIIRLEERQAAQEKVNQEILKRIEVNQAQADANARSLKGQISDLENTLLSILRANEKTRAK